jgi:hypothetical protein
MVAVQGSPRRPPHYIQSYNYFVYFRLYIFTYEMGKLKDSELNNSKQNTRTLHELFIVEALVTCDLSNRK